VVGVVEEVVVVEVDVSMAETRVVEGASASAPLRPQTAKAPAPAATPAIATMSSLSIRDTGEG
jgi:hypothetical protein